MKGKILLTIIPIAVLILSGCGHKTIIPPHEELGNTPVPTPSSFDETLMYIVSYSAEERIVGMWVALSYPEESSIVIPSIIQNLYYEPVYDVRDAAAEVLGEFGPAAASAVPDLITVMQNDRSIHVRVASAVALGNIGDKRAVPFLAENLYYTDNNYDNNYLAIFSARSISILTGEGFPDSDSKGGYRLDKQGVPLIVIAAREWWEKEGKYDNWDAP